MVVFDFGMLRTLPAGYLLREGPVLTALWNEDRAALFDAMLSLGYLGSDGAAFRGEEEIELLFAHMKIASDWLFQEQPYRLGPEAQRAIGEQLLALGPGWRRIARAFSLPREAVLLRRMADLLFVGFCQLRAAGDWWALAQELQLGGEPSTRAGRRARGLASPEKKRCVGGRTFARWLLVWDMATLRANQRDSVIARIADSQWGVVSREQLLAAKLSRDQIGDALRAKRLRRILPGVYAVGHIRLRREAWWQAALLYCGEGAVLSHRSAAVAWGMLPGDGVEPVDVIARGNAGRDQKGINPRRIALHKDDYERRFGMWVTTPARTIADNAGVMRGRALRELIERAEDARRFDRVGIEGVLARSPRLPGRRDLLTLVRLLGPDRDGARSELERRFLRLCRSHGLPKPDVNIVVEARRRDFVWPQHRLVVETDGYRWHSSRKAMRRDRARDRELMLAGWRPIRFTYEDVIFEPSIVVADFDGFLR